MATDRPLRNLTRDRLFGVYLDLHSEPSTKKYNLRKELQTDKRENAIYANRWVTRDQYLELAQQEIAARGLDLPSVEGEALPVTTPAAEAEAADTSSTSAEATPAG